MKKQSCLKKTITPKSPHPPFTKGGQGEIKNEKGYVLIVTLLALLAVTIIGVLALSTSTTEVTIAGNARLREINISSADAGVAVSEPVMRNPDRRRYAFLTASQEQNLRNEIFCGSQLNPDTENFVINIGGNNISVDIDFIDAADPGAGYALEEGGPPILRKHYAINSTSTDALGSEGEVGALYYNVGYCD